MSPFDDTLSARERQIMDAVYRLERATVNEVRDNMPDPPSANAVRTMLGTLTDKGLLKKAYQGRAAVYQAALKPDRTAREALDRVLSVFHRGSIVSALKLHLSDPSRKLSKAEVAELHDLIDKATHRGEKR